MKKNTECTALKLISLNSDTEKEQAETKAWFNSLLRHQARKQTGPTLQNLIRVSEWSEREQIPGLPATRSEISGPNF